MHQSWFAIRKKNLKEVEEEESRMRKYISTGKWHEYDGVIEGRDSMSVSSSSGCEIVFYLHIKSYILPFIFWSYDLVWGFRSDINLLVPGRAETTTDIEGGHVTQ